MDIDPNKFVVSHFEYAVYTGQHELAGRMLLQLLALLDGHYGNIPPQLEAKGYSQFASREDFLDHVFTRLAAAVTALFADPEFQLSVPGFLQALPLQRWLGVIFSYTPMRNADHIIYSLNNLGRDSEVVQWSARDVFKMALLTLPDSQIPMDLEMIWQVQPVLAVSLAMVWVTPRLLTTLSAHHRREVVLGWLPPKFEKLSLSDLDGLPKNVWHDLYMHSSYAIREDKHKIKKVIHEACHKLLTHNGIKDLPLKNLDAYEKKNGKRVMISLVEWFHSAHSVYRTHSSTLRAAKKSFYVVGIGLPNCVDENGKEVFDEYIELTPGSLVDQIKQIRKICEDYQACVFYMPSVGMHLTTIFAASLRLALVQATSLGHGASTQSPWMDYFIVDEDYVGNVSTYSEKVLAMPTDVMTITPSSAMQSTEITPVINKKPEAVKIAVAATTMKINPIFLETLRQIQLRSNVAIEFNFFIGFATELIWPLVRRMIKSILGDSAIVNPHLDYPIYMEKMNACDMFVTPFPYGNMNGIVDAVTCGLVGVCKSGPHVHEHIDVGLFKRLGLPDWSITKTNEGYIEATLRLANDHKERHKLRTQIIKNSPVNKLNAGRPEFMGEKLIEVLEHTAKN